MSGVMGNELFVDFSRALVQVRGSDGYTRPIVIDLRRGMYFPSDQDIERRMPTVASELAATWPSVLLALQDTPEGAPYRTAKVFLRHGQIQHKQKDDAGQIRVVSSECYFAAAGGQPWDHDFQRNDPGVFVTGNSARSTVWRVFRIEPDAFGASVLTLSPVVLVGGFPQLELSALSDSLSAEIFAHYEELQRHVLGHAYRAVITSAKNVVEALLSPQKNLSETLLKMGNEILGAKAKREPLPNSEMAYHLAEKLRLLHQRTHPGATQRQGRSVSPEFALTVVQDLIEILRELGFVKG